MGTRWGDTLALRFSERMEADTLFRSVTLNVYGAMETES
jgi:hypothetical protein